MISAKARNTADQAKWMHHNSLDDNLLGDVVDLLYCLTDSSSGGHLSVCVEHVNDLTERQILSDCKRSGAHRNVLHNEKTKSPDGVCRAMCVLGQCCLAALAALSSMVVEVAGGGVVEKTRDQNMRESLKYSVSTAQMIQILRTLCT